MDRSQLIWPSSAPTLGRRFRKILGRLVPLPATFSLGSLRAGGATFLFGEFDEDLQRLAWRGRWRQINTLAHYVQELAASRIGMAWSSSVRRNQLRSQGEQGASPADWSSAHVGIVHCQKPYGGDLKSQPKTTARERDGRKRWFPPLRPRGTRRPMAALPPRGGEAESPVPASDRCEFPNFQALSSKFLVSVPISKPTLLNPTANIPTVCSLTLQLIAPTRPMEPSPTRTPRINFMPTLKQNVMRGVEVKLMRNMFPTPLEE